MNIIKELDVTLPRKLLVDSDVPGFYHCTNRCVRRAFLCGVDEETGRDYNHRKTWLERRMKTLCHAFSIDIYAYAIMDNHYHIVLYLDPKLPQAWSDDEVAERWLNAFPCKQPNLRKQAIVNCPETLTKYRQRLGSLSWFMRRLNEPLAKLSNQEDQCTGRFWQGRFSSQALLDEAAILSCMVYVDLNPVRANITQKLEESQHTAIKQRLEDVTQTIDKADKLKQPLAPVAGQTQSRRLSLPLTHYIQLVEWTGQTIVHPNKASIPSHITPILERLNLQQHHWLKQVQQMGQHYTHVIGPVELIRAKAKQWKKRYLRGIAAAKLLYQPLR